MSSPRCHMAFSCSPLPARWPDYDSVFALYRVSRRRRCAELRAIVLRMLRADAAMSSSHCRFERQVPLAAAMPGEPPPFAPRLFYADTVVYAATISMSPRPSHWDTPGAFSRYRKPPSAERRSSADAERRYTMPQITPPSAEAADLMLPPSIAQPFSPHFDLPPSVTPDADAADAT